MPWPMSTKGFYYLRIANWKFYNNCIQTWLQGST